MQSSDVPVHVRSEGRGVRALCLLDGTPDLSLLIAGLWPRKPQCHRGLRRYANGKAPQLSLFRLPQVVVRSCRSRGIEKISDPGAARAELPNQMPLGEITKLATRRCLRDIELLLVFAVRDPVLALDDLDRFDLPLVEAE